MRLFMIANANSIHTQRWAVGLAQRGIEIFLFSLPELRETSMYAENNIKVFSYGFSTKFTMQDGFGLSKLKYMFVLSVLKNKIKTFSPDIVHAHYASGYGTLGALSHFDPFILSVWGSDIYDFPQKSWLHKRLISYNLKKADRILSTSHVMAKETAKYTDKMVEVTPFGIDLTKFFPESEHCHDSDNTIVIGTVKTLEKKYGIEYLIKAFKVIVDKYPQLPLQLMIVGGGSLAGELKDLANKLHIGEIAHFVGTVPYDDIPKYHNIIDIPLFLSIEDSESFGVAAIEASACEKAVIVSDKGGLKEVIEDGVSGFVVSAFDYRAAAEKIEILLRDKPLREKMGKAGRERVKKLYNWDENIKQMIEIYKDLKK
ncbi:MAG TPA: glycosyltransferase family 4 protein [Epsilonproteobacteria bacterium]|nr:glycosyltransferase family 4 protein [Campylobacterota bacterium]HHD78514.1 glycosyltransferase family 4 protein [Campylobacterota bacterium]